MKLPHTRFDWMVVTVLAAVLGIAWIGITRVEASQINITGRPPSPDLGYSAPDFTLSTLDGGTLTLSDLRGKPVILNFWASWCGPCRVEIPALEAASQKAGSTAVIVGVDVLESPAVVEAFVAEMGMTYPIALDTSGEVSDLYRVQGFPTTYFIDAQGVIVEVYHGQLNEPLLRDRIRALASE